MLVRARRRRRGRASAWRACSRASTTSRRGRGAACGRCAGTCSSRGSGFASETASGSIGSVDRIVHCAASISFELPLDEAREINVGASARVIELAARSRPAGSLRRLVHVSTAYVGGRHAGVFGEQDLDLGQEFRNTYEHSKYEAEQRCARPPTLPLVIARPSIIVGDSRSGWTPVFNVIYWPMRAFERGLMDEVRPEPTRRGLRAGRLRRRRPPRAARRSATRRAPTTWWPASRR